MAKHGKYQSVVEKAAIEAFKKEIERIHYKICLVSCITRREGLLAAEKLIDKEKAGDILEYTLQMATDAIDRDIIEKYIDSWAEANCSGHFKYYNKILLSVIKTGVLGIQSGLNPRVVNISTKPFVPLELMPNWTEFYPEGIKQYGWMLEFMPEEFRTEEICGDAVKACGDMLEFVPEKFRTKEICAEAIKQSGIALKYTPEEFKTEELCHDVIQKNGGALAFVPEKFKTKEFCMEAFEQDVNALASMPKELKTKELCAEAIKRNGCVLNFVPEEFKTAELCMEAVKNSEYAIRYVPMRLRTAELFIEIIKQRRKDESFEGIEIKYLLDDVPESMKDKIWEAVYQSELEAENG